MSVTAKISVILNEGCVYAKVCFCAAFFTLSIIIITSINFFISNSDFIAENHVEKF